LSVSSRVSRPQPAANGTLIGTGSGFGGQVTATELQRLASLVSQGLITQEEYDEKKRLILHLDPSPRSSSRKPTYQLYEAPTEPQYWYMLGGDIAGPYSMGVLVGRAAAGIILPSTPVAPSPTGPWTKAKGVSALRGQLRDVEDPTGDTPTTRRTGTALLLVPLFGILISCLLQGLGVGGPAVPVLAAFLLVLLTALLVWWDASLVGISDRSSNGKRQTGPFGWAAATLLLWAFCYPAYMYRRGRTGARQLLAPAIVVTLLFVGAPFITAAVFPPLPTVDSYAVTSTFAKALRESPGSKQLIEAGLLNDDILNPTEVSFDPWEQRRIGRGQVRTALGLETVTFSVSWQSRRRNQIWVEVNPQAANDFAHSVPPPKSDSGSITARPVPPPPPPEPVRYTAQQVAEAHAGLIKQIDRLALQRLGAGHRVLAKPLEVSKQVLLFDDSSATATSLDSAFIIRYRFTATVGDEMTGHGAQSVLVLVDVAVLDAAAKTAMVLNTSDLSGFDELSKLLSSANRLAKSEFELAAAVGDATSAHIDRMRQTLDHERAWLEFTIRFVGEVIGLDKDVKALRQ
jgi:hypothetical protein